MVTITSTTTTVSRLGLFFFLLAGMQCETATAEIIRGLKKDKGNNNNKGCGSCRDDPSVATFPMCDELIPTVPPASNPNFVFENMETTCTTTFWENKDPWINGSPLYVAYYPVCSCVILAKDCFLPAVSTFAPMYDVARSTGMSREDAINFSIPFVHEECLTYALAFLDQWAKDDDEDPHSND